MLMCVVVLCTSCASSKKVVYLQDVVPLKQQDIKQKYEVYVHNDDLLAIMVNSKNQMCIRDRSRPARTLARERLDGFAAGADAKAGGTDCAGPWGTLKTEYET